MGYRNPIRSLPADNITGGEFTGDYTIPGRFTVGDPAHGHITLDGASESLKLYAADGVTVLVDLEPTGAIFTGTVQTAIAGARAELGPAITTPAGTGPGVLLTTGSADELESAGIAAFPIGGGAPGPYLAVSAPSFGGPPGGWLQLFGVPKAPTIYSTGARLTTGGGLFDLLPDGGDVIFSGGQTATTIGQIRTVLGWTAAALQNAWANFGGAFQTASYSKLVTGDVIVRGLITAGTTAAGTLLFTLPAGYRPAAQRVFAVMSGGAVAARVDVLANGQVVLQSGGISNTYLSLDGIRFVAGA